MSEKKISIIYSIIMVLLVFVFLGMFYCLNTVFEKRTVEKSTVEKHTVERKQAQ